MTDAEVSRLSTADKIAEALRRSLPHLPSEARYIVEGLLQPGTIAMVTATIVIWAGSHFFGVGEIVDLILVGVGVVGLGFAVFEGAGALFDFATGAMNARSNVQLDTAGKNFARAVTILGIGTVQAVLLRGQAGKVVSRGAPKIYPRPSVGTPRQPETSCASRAQPRSPVAVWARPILMGRSRSRATSPSASSGSHCCMSSCIGTSHRALAPYVKFARSSAGQRTRDRRCCVI